MGWIVISSGSNLICGEEELGMGEVVDLSVRSRMGSRHCCLLATSKEKVMEATAQASALVEGAHDFMTWIRVTT